MITEWNAVILTVKRRMSGAFVCKLISNLA